MDKMTYKEAYLEALEVTQMIYNLYVELTKYKIRGTLLSDQNAEKINNLVDLLNDVLDKEIDVYNEIDSSFNLSELSEFMNYVEELGEITPVAVDFEKLSVADTWLIPRRIINHVNNLFRYNSENVKVVVLNDIKNEESNMEDADINIARFNREYIQTVTLEDAYIEDHTRFFLAELESWLNRKSPINLEQAKFYQEMVTAQMMIMFTDFVDERFMISKRFEFSDKAVCLAPFVESNLRYIARDRDTIKSISVVNELKFLLEDFITVEEKDISDSRSSVVKLNKMYFEAGLKTLDKKEFNDVLETYKDLLSLIAEDNEKYYSEDSIRIVRNILNKVSREKFKVDIIKANEEKEEEKSIRKKSSIKVMLQNKFLKSKM